MVLALKPAILNASRERIFFFKKERLPPSGFSSHAGYSKCIKKANFFFFMKERFLPRGLISNELFKKHHGKVLIDLAGLLVLMTIPFPQSFRFTLDFFCTLFAKLTL